MTIKELLRASELSSDRAQNADTVAKRESEFDLISAIARKLRRLRKRKEAKKTADARNDAATSGSE